MKRYLFVFFAALSAFMSCQKEQPEELQDQQMIEFEIEAGIQSKTTLDGTTVLWEGGDRLALVFQKTGDRPHVNKTLVNTQSTQSTPRATFKGRIPMDVSEDNGYQDIGMAVYPVSAVTDQGAFSHDLPSVQEAMPSGSFPSGCNLSYAALSLTDIREDGSVTADFASAMSLLRLMLSPDIESVTVTGTAPLSGTAPLQIADGRLAVVQGGKWSEKSNSVTLMAPAEGFEAKIYNMLVWPGRQEGLSIKVNFRNIGEYEKISSISPQQPVVFKPGKFYNLNFTNQEELIVSEVTDRLDDLEDDVPSIGGMEGEVNDLVSQIQSVALMTEYLDNSVYAPYASYQYSKEKLDIELSYVVRPVHAAELIIKNYDKVLSAVIAYKDSEKAMSYDDLAVKSASLSGDVLTVSVDASGIDDRFYSGTIASAEVALQISDGNSEYLSDFARLVPKSGSAISGIYSNISAIPGAKVTIPFTFAVAEMDAGYTIDVQASQNVTSASVSYNNDFRMGNLTVHIHESNPIASQNVTVRMTVGNGENAEVVTRKYTFADNGARITLSSNGDVDYIGGDAVVTVASSNLPDGFLTLVSGNGVSQSGNIFTFGENTGGQRTADVEYSVSVGSLQYAKNLTLIQKAYGTALSKTYYSNGQKIVLNQANASGCSNYLNVVILGDGYKKKDLVTGGRFERSARSAMENFFAVEPYKTYMNRFNVYMVAYESAEEGTDIKASGIVKNTYFSTYCQGGGNTACYLANADQVVNVVKNVVGLSSDAQYYRTIVIMLVNTDENAGSTGYPVRTTTSVSTVGDGYASFAIACLAANSTGFNGLVKHEAGGHAFGRLADEYYSGGTITPSKITELNDWHSKGWYWNVTADKTYWNNFKSAGYSASEVDYVEGAWNYAYGIYRPTAGGMMQSNTGTFNAPSRHAIYHRIIKQTEGANGYSWQKFIDYDRKNR